MKEKKFIKMHMPHAIAVFFMLMFCVMGMMTGTKVQAAEYNNPAYTFMSTKDASISTTANPGQTTVLIFGHTRCGYTRETFLQLGASFGYSRDFCRDQRTFKRGGYFLRRGVSMRGNDLLL